MPTIVPHTMSEENLSLALGRGSVRTLFGFPQLEVRFHIYPCPFFQTREKFVTRFVKTKNLMECNQRRRAFCASESKYVNGNLDNYFLVTSVGVRWKTRFGRNSITCKRRRMSVSIVQNGLINAYLTNSFSCLVSFVSGSLAKYPMSVSLERSLARVLDVEKAC